MFDEETSLEDAARWYAKNGFWVMPMDRQSGAPPYNWKTDLGANIRLITGHKSGLFVVVCSTPEAERWFLNTFPFLYTAEAQAPGEVHFYFQGSTPMPTLIQPNGLDLTM